MKSKTISFVMQGLLFVAATVALAPPSAMALGDEVGKFTIPVEVRWGKVVLPPGVYSISAAAHGTSSMLCVYKEGSPTVGYFIPAVEQETIPVSSQKTQLILDEKEGTIYVKELQLAGDGLELHYAAPTSKKNGRL